MRRLVPAPLSLCLVSALSALSACGVFTEPPPFEEENLPPLARAEGTIDGTTDSVFVFDGSRSSDDDGVIVEHLWEFEDGTAAAGAVIEKTWERAGTFGVVLTVVDDDGEIAQDVLYAYVEGVVTAHIAPVEPLTFGVPGLLDASGTTGTGGEIDFFAWDTGDGEVLYGAVVEHTYAFPGDYLVTLYVEDEDGVEATAEQLVTVYIPSFDGTWSWAIDGGDDRPFGCAPFPTSPLTVLDGTPLDDDAFVLVQDVNGEEVTYEGVREGLAFTVGRSAPGGFILVEGTLTAPDAFTATYEQDPSGSDACPAWHVSGTRT